MEKRPSKFLITIVGPTAVGKTALSIQLAKEWNTEIISADSRQLFKEMSIGTAKPLLHEMQGVTHHFIDSHSITEAFNVGKFEEAALALLHEAFKTKDVLLLVGGSGLYVDAICKGFDPLPKADNAIRQQLMELYKTRGIAVLQNQLNELDPDYFNQVDKANPHRLIRALEVCLITGRPYAALRKGAAKSRNFNSIKIGLHLDRQQLYERVNQRVDDMMQAGFLNEVKQLYAHKHLNALQTVGYKELFDHLDGKYDLETAVALMKQNTRRFAKRQLTWFRKDKEINWFKPDERDKIAGFINRSMNNSLNA